MDTKNYNVDDIQALIDDTTKITTGIEELSQGIDVTCSSLDTRVVRNFEEIFSNLTSTNTALKNEAGDVGSYGTWLGTTLSSFDKTNTTVKQIAGDSGASDLNANIDGTVTGNPLDFKGEQYNLDPSAIEKLTSEEKDVIKQKLKDLGYSDAEIESILSGETSVDKATLDELSSTLEKITSEHPDVRTQLKELYGFDLFNEDGSVNKDKLALAMIMDSKDPNDQYDLQTFLKQFGISDLEKVTGGTSDSIDGISGVLFPGGTDSSTTTGGNVDTHVENLDSLFNVLDSDNNSNGTNGSIGLLSANGLSSIANSGNSGSLLDVLGSDDTNDLLGDELSNNVGAVGSTEKVVPEILDTKKGGFGGVAAVAGIGSAVAATGGGIAYAKKKKDGKNDDEDEEEEIEDEKSLEDKENKKDGDKKNSKEWLYGLGIGLAGLALLPDDDDEEEDKKNEEEEPY